jgi:hypothetical protein
MIERGENSIKFKGLSYKIVTGPSGRKWLDRNIGATKVADSSTDIPAYGDYFPFSSNNDARTRRRTITLAVTSSWQLKEAGEGCSNIFNLSFVREESGLCR